MRSSLTALKVLAVLSALVLAASAGTALAEQPPGPAASQPPAAQAPGGFQGPAAQPQGGGFQGPSAQAQVTTAAQALKAWDDTPVTLTGHVVQRMPGDDDDYLFRDATGEIVVEIDHEVFQGRTVTPQTKVRISGEVDTHKFRPATVDVKWLEIL